MKIVLVGAGGYGQVYVSYLLGNSNLSSTLEGIVEPNIDKCPAKEAILAAGIPIYVSLSEFYEEHEADLAMICTPPFLHCEHSVCALSHNSYVLCEKPIASIVRDAQAMIRAEKKYNKFIAIGYQWAFSEAMQALKKDILAGKLGKPVFFKTFVSWPRNKAYYARGGGWAGKTSMNGIRILDSIASNACAHYIQNMLFLLGKDMNCSALPVKMEAECLRANDIETFDTCILRMQMENDTQLYLAATHVAEKKINPEFVYEFEYATVEFKTDANQGIVAKFHNGEIFNYGDPSYNNVKKIDDCIKAVENNETPICTAQTAYPHVKLVEKLHENLTITTFPKEVLRELNNQISVKKLHEELYECYQTRSLLSEKSEEYAKTVTVNKIIF